MVWDSLRNRQVVATPEEKVRQSLIRKMIEELGFPKSLIAAEKNLRNYGTENRPNRRFDIVCYTLVLGEMTPLLLVECKAGVLNSAAEQQALGYNAIVGAPFVCIANGSEIKTMWQERDRLASVPFLPTYAQMAQHASLKGP